MAETALRPYESADRDGVVALWRLAGLVRPWNDPDADIAFCRAAAGHAELLVAREAGRLVGTVMVGHDGHRGWVYYVAVAPERQSTGLGRRLMDAAEAWLRGKGAPKVQLMVRAENAGVRAFYRRLGYSDTHVAVMEKWLAAPPAAKPKPTPQLDIVVTSLEMKAPPRLPRFATPAKVALLRLEKPSVPFYRFLYDTVGEKWFWYERRAMSDAALAAAINAPGIEITVLYRGGEPAGFVELDWRDPANVNLGYFGLVPAAIGQGLGAWLLGETVAEVWRRGPGRFWVHTCTLDHPKALAFYQRMGFVPYHQEARRIDDPRALGLIPPATPLPAGAAVLSSAP
jgi:GNAT superfamily N-acetyltransferase